jgi:hypothetical protein
MTTYDVGDVTRLSITFTQGGAAIDPSTVSLTVQQPDGTQTTYTYTGATITRDSLGNYHVDVSLTLVGTHRYRWVSTGTGAAAEEGSIAVRVRRVN